MAIHEYGTAAGRSNIVLAADFLYYAIPMERVTKWGRLAMMDRNRGDTYIARRYLPHGATADTFSSQNQFFADGTGDRGLVYAQEHESSETGAGNPDSLIPVDVTVVMKYYEAQYGFSRKMAELYEDKIPEEMKERTGHRITLVNEHVSWGQLRASTNQFYAKGSSIATVAGPVSLDILRAVTRGIEADHGYMITSVISPDDRYGTVPTEEGFIALCHSDLAPDWRVIPGFDLATKYAGGKKETGELGVSERIRVIMCPDLIPQQDAGALKGSLGLLTTSDVNIDVYQIVVMAAKSWSKIAVRGLSAIESTFIPAERKEKTDVHGKRGYVGALWRYAALLENDAWVAVINVGARTLTV